MNGKKNHIHTRNRRRDNRVYPHRQEPDRAALAAGGSPWFLENTVASRKKSEVGQGS